MTKPLRILSVEDSSDDEQLIRAELRRSGVPFELKRVEDRDSLEEALREPWDVILSDYTLPSFSAPEALSTLLESGHDIPFIVVSGSVGEDVAVEAMKSGAADYFRKENITRLVPAIRREVAEKARRAEKRSLESRLEHALAIERRLRVEAESANRTKDEFLATVSHELRTPMNAILAAAHLLRSPAASAEMREHAVEAIERNATAQTRLVDDLLDVTQLTAGTLQLEPSPVDLAVAIGEELRAFSQRAATKGVALHAQLAAAGTVRVDRARFGQIVAILIDNALKFTPSGGEVTVRLEPAGDRVVVEVRDTGEGITRELLDTVFERFRQADQSTKRRHGGLGLGLAIAKALVELHGGTLTAASAGPGRGASFRAELPAIQATTAAPSPRSVAATRPLEGIRILVVDDDPDGRELLGDLIADYGAEVRLAGGTDQALAMIDADPPDVLVSDIGMPVRDGYDLIQELRTRAHDRGGSVPAIALTAYATTADRQRARAAGFQCHLAKPVRPRAVVEAILEIAPAR